MYLERVMLFHPPLLYSYNPNILFVKNNKSKKEVPAVRE